ncbi:sterol desaturase family protein [Halobacteriovorax sp. JY17]|uniref:sterol desaturase family protein n=1 Tax=Halobacteriovorax sp. JY17 TaxID=2014617 RepID=UPI0025C3E5C4|nr:sterol desaturase family protein [Halobacteriovorax sp. JY17]
MSYRLLAFLSILFIFSFLELYLKRRDDPNPLGERWSRKLSNFLLLSVGALFSLLFIRVAPMASSEFASAHEIGILNWLKLPFFAEVIVGVIFLDLIIYFQHRAFHRFNFLWRFHKVHHVDNLLDSTTALRFHPIEILLSLFVKSLAILVLGVRGDVVLVFEFILSSMAIFNHANIQLPIFVEKYLKFFLVTPNFHVIHHHPEKEFHNSNFGFNLSFWDYIFKTSQSGLGIDFSNYKCGLEGEEENSLKGMLEIPFRKLD